MSIPNHFEVVRRVFEDGRFDLSTKEGCGRFTEACAVALHRIDGEFGHLRKRPAQNQYNGHAVDALLYRATGQTVDLIISSGGPESRINWLVNEGDAYSPDMWYPPDPQAAGPAPAGGGIQTGSASMEGLAGALMTLSEAIAGVSRELAKMKLQP
jgi:hypothetical protein